MLAQDLEILCIGLIQNDYIIFICSLIYIQKNVCALKM